MRTRIIIAIALFLLSIITYYASFNRSLIFTTSAISSLSFWFAVLLLIPNRFFKLVLNVKRAKAYWISLGLYLFFHVTLYGFFYGIILGLDIFIPVVTVNYGVGIPPSSILLFPYWESLSPAINIILLGYEDVISPFITFIGVILALLLAANIEKILELKREVSRRKASAVLIGAPLIGVVSGTSCCLSLPSIIIYFVALDLGVVFSVLPILASPVYFAFVWYGLPIGSVFLLLENLIEMNKVLRKLSKRKCQVK
ncbi:hypothetical protein [Acidianus sp. HS-5]|uniref:hypothetical protein n=1 Tax=Acidianus sp. HS-5 TaxID=2886040 RepID=UPI001F1AC03A|nr:hypothetical protein [Acidianus sp. HS-5]